MRTSLVVVAAAAAVSCGCTGDDGAGGASPALSPTPATSPSASATGDDLDSYTDPGDGCNQAISAIAYADDSLRALGQEPYQEFTDAIRSRLAAVAGTLALEARDWPSPAVAAQAKVVQPLAQAASDPAPEHDPTRIRTLLRYRIEAGRLVLLCRDAAAT